MDSNGREAPNRKCPAAFPFFACKQDSGENQNRHEPVQGYKSWMIAFGDCRSLVDLLVVEVIEVVVMFSPLRPVVYRAYMNTR